MRFTSFRLWRRAAETDPLSLLTVTPPGSGERTLVGVENMLQAIATREPFSLEVAADADGAALMVRCPASEIVRGQISAHYPQAVIAEIGPEDDPLRPLTGETVRSVSLRSAGPEHAPLRTFRDRDLLDPGSDPFLGVLGAMSPLAGGERIVAQLLLRPLGPDWSFRHVADAYEPPSVRPNSIVPSGSDASGPGNPKTMAVFGAVALAGLRAYTWIQAGETWKAVVLGAVLVFGLGAGAWVWNRWRSGREGSFDPAAVRDKVSSPAFEAEICITAFVPDEGDGDADRRAGELVDRVATAYRRFDNPAGARLETARLLEQAPDPDEVTPTVAGFLRPRSIFGAREAAGLWHPPGAGDETPLVERSGARALLPSVRGVRGGAHAGGGGRIPAGRRLGSAGAPAARQGRPRRSPRRRHCSLQAAPRQIPRGSPSAAPLLRRPHPDGEIHTHAPRRRVQDVREGRGQGRRRHRRRRSPRRSRRRTARTRAAGRRGQRPPHRSR